MLTRTENESNQTLIPIVELQIEKNCVTRHEDDPKIQNIKEVVLAKFDHCFPETPIMKLHQLLDRETKNLISSQEATRILEDGLQDANRANFIVQTQPSTTSSASRDDGNDDAEFKMKRTRMEYVNELRSSAQDCEDSGVCIFSCILICFVIVTINFYYKNILFNNLTRSIKERVDVLSDILDAVTR